MPTEALRRFRTLCAVLGALVVVTGCASIGAPSAEPSVVPSLSLPSLGVTTPRPQITSSPQASSAPTAPASGTPASASFVPQASASPGPTSPPIVPPPPPPSREDGDLLFFDDMDDPSSGWGTGEIGNSIVSFNDDGELSLDIGDAGQAIWSPRRVVGEFGVLLVAGGYVISGDGGVGAACVTADGDLYGAEMTTTGQLIFFSIVDGATRALDTKDDLDVQVEREVFWAFGVECTGLSTGALRLVAVMSGQGPIGIYQDN